MQTVEVGSQQTPGADWKRAEFVLTLFGFLGFATLLVRVNTFWAGLPAHPLFVHVPVVFIPVTVVTALIGVARPAFLRKHGVLICAIAIFAMSSTFLAMQAGGALRGDLNLQGEAGRLIAEHSSAATVLAIAFVALTACLILMFASERISTGMPTGLKLADDILGAPAVRLLLRGAVLVLALIAMYYVYRVGDLGAKAVWAGRLHTAAAGR
jgi:uncharacterized membrane protein